tara:strand:- start:12 stop:947 length:936 start_codon:yes stop_codon:yes gene_type:complete
MAENTKKTVKDGKIIKENKSFTVNKDGKKVLKPRSIVKDLGRVLPFLPIGRIGGIASKVPGVKSTLKKIGDKVVKGARGAANKIQQRNTKGQGGGKFNPPNVKPNRSNKNSTAVSKRKTTEIKKPSTAVVKNSPKRFSPNRGPNTQQLANRAVVTSGVSELIKPKKSVAKPIEKKKEPVIKKPNKPPIKKDKKPNIIKSKPIKKTNITAGGNTGFGAKGNVFVSSEKRRKELMDKFGGTGSAAAKAAMRGTQGNMVKRAAGGLKPVPEGNKGLGKLPSPVRNKMGYMKKGGIVKMRGGGAATRGMNFNRGR